MRGDLIPDFVKSRVLVAGDVMADVYWAGATSRISPEAPVPVVRVETKEIRPGGAANVAMNVSSLGSSVTLVGLIGDDDTGVILEQRLTESGVNCALCKTSGASTIRKLRVMSRRQQLVRLDFEHDFSTIDAQLKITLVSDRLGSCDVLVISDYSKGFFGTETKNIIKIATQAGKPVVVDPKGVDYSRYIGATVITPNIHEFESVVGCCRSEQEIVERGGNLLKELDLHAVLITRGEQGMTLIEHGSEPLHLPSRAREVFDVTGAGDTVVAALAASVAAGLPLREAVDWSNVAAGIVVAKSGTSTASVAEIVQARHQLARQDTDKKILELDSLKEVFASARRAGKNVVMTNGCFDILHAGHVDLLQRARKLGDMLIVAINDDASVSRLKGPSRPVNKLAHRLAVLAGLECVDYVLAFSEDSPERLYCETPPDVLVKGGDYSIEQVAGKACVVATGGQVVILKLVDGLSTTEILAKQDTSKSRHGR